MSRAIGRTTSRRETKEQSGMESDGVSTQHSNASLSRMKENISSMRRITVQNFAGIFAVVVVLLQNCAVFFLPLFEPPPCDEFSSQRNFSGATRYATEVKWEEKNDSRKKSSVHSFALFVADVWCWLEIHSSLFEGFSGVLRLSTEDVKCSMWFFGKDHATASKLVSGVYRLAHSTAAWSNEIKIMALNIFFRVWVSVGWCRKSRIFWSWNCVSLKFRPCECFELCWLLLASSLTSLTLLIVVGTAWWLLRWSEEVGIHWREEITSADSVKYLFGLFASSTQLYESSAAAFDRFKCLNNLHKWNLLSLDPFLVSFVRFSEICASSCTAGISVIDSALIQFLVSLLQQQQWIADSMDCAMAFN